MNSRSIVELFYWLPIEVLRTIFSLYLEGEGKYAIFEATKEFNILRKQLNYFKLSRFDSTQFIVDLSFRDRVLSSIVHPQDQLSLQLEQTSLKLDELDFMSFLPVHSVDIAGFERFLNFDALGRLSRPLKSLSIYRSRGAVDIAACQGIKHLRVTHCPNIINIDQLRSVITFHMENSLKGLIGARPFVSLQKLDIGDCPDLEDISPLANIPSLRIERCPKVTNIDCLTHRNKVLILVGCYIQHITIHSSKSDIRLEDAYLLETFTAIDVDVYELSFDSCSELVSVSVMGRVRHLTYNSCESLTDLSGPASRFLFFVTL